MSTQPKVKRLPIPSSGQLLASIVRALELDVPNDLAGRYFRGESVTPETRDRIYARVAETIVPALGLESHAQVITEVVRAALAMNSARWDDVVGVLGSITRHGPSEWRNIAPVFGMVAVVELAVRVGAMWHMAKAPPSADDGALAAIIEPQRGTLLRKIVQRAGLSRARLAEQINTSAKTVDDWLDGRHRPDGVNLERLAQALAPPLQQAPAALLATLRRYFAIWEIRNRLVESLGANHGNGLPCMFAGYAIDVYGFLSMSRLPKEQIFGSTLVIAMKGLEFESTVHILRHLWRSEERPHWRGVLRGCMGDWFGLLQHALAAASNYRQQNVDDLDPADAVILAICDPMESLSPEISEHEWRAMAAADPALACARLEHQGELNMALHMFQDAVRSFRGALALQPQVACYHYRLGCALWRPPGEDRSEIHTDDHDRDLKEAEQELWLAHRLASEAKDQPGAQLALVELGWLMLDTHRIAEALDLAESFKTRFPDRIGQAAYFVGEARRANGMLEPACAAYREALRKQPTHLLADEALRETRALIAKRAQ